MFILRGRRSRSASRRMFCNLENGDCCPFLTWYLMMIPLGKHRTSDVSGPFFVAGAIPLKALEKVAPCLGKTLFFEISASVVLSARSNLGVCKFRPRNPYGIWCASDRCRCGAVLILFLLQKLCRDSIQPCRAIKDLHKVILHRICKECLPRDLVKRASQGCCKRSCFKILPRGLSRGIVQRSCSLFHKKARSCTLP